MKRTIRYKGIREVVYFLNQYQLRDFAIDYIESNHLYVKPKGKSSYSIEWLYDEDGEMSGLKVKQENIEEDEPVEMREGGKAI